MMSCLLIDGVSLGDDGDDVDLAIELLHAHEVETLEAVSIWSDKVQARVNPRVVEAVRSSLRESRSPGFFPLASE